GWTSALTKNLSLPAHIFQAAGYQYSTCDPARNAIATLPNLINHGNITGFLDQYKPDIAAAKRVGAEFVVGEYNSVSCSGKENVTNTFGQALWLADTVLYGATIDISRMYLHQGATLVFQSSVQANTYVSLSIFPSIPPKLTTHLTSLFSPGFSWYDQWYPTTSDRYGPPHAGPSFVALLLITETIGSSHKSQISLIPTPAFPQLAVYAVWDPVARPERDGPARVAVLNLATRNVTTTGEEESVVLDLGAYVRKKGRGGKKGAVVKRMTSPGLDSTDTRTATWAGQHFWDGKPNGKEVTEGLVNGKVTVKGSEGVLVFF
ncbi:hypothetical protein BXZ70DRAFT_906948, partial [Cristinia sonorae]